MTQNDYHITAFRMLYNVIQKKCQNAVKDLDITMSQGGALASIAESPNGEMSLKELEKKLQLSQSVTAGLVSRMEQKGLVESYGSAEDRRIKILKITEPGKEKCLAGQKILKKTEKELLAPLSEAEKKALFEIVEKLLEHNK